MQFKNLTLDKFQKDAIDAVEKNNSVVVSAPTGSGKTLIADYIIDKHLGDGSIIIYTAPIKALSNQKYKDFCKDYGKDSVGLITGDIVINPGAPVLVMTTEIYRNMTIINDPMLSSVKYVIFDEIHYINDIERGYVWEESIIFSKKHVRFLCLSATIPNVKEFSAWISAIKKHKVEVVKYTNRPVPLEKKFFDAELGITTLEELKKRTEMSLSRKRLWGTPNRREMAPIPKHTELIKEIKE
ncbi:MAG: DEAD/DEAH box helicase, partial [Candidatus Aenigmarchaeota archaeon]|nr:DEAD/DEAH box helicase [Candidatus Aenigmarchaeota archaeon]